MSAKLHYSINISIAYLDILRTVPESIDIAETINR